MPRGGLAAFGAVLAVLCGAAWYLVPRWALLWVLLNFLCMIFVSVLTEFCVFFLTFVKFIYL